MSATKPTFAAVFRSKGLVSNCVLWFPTGFPILTKRGSYHEDLSCQTIGVVGSPLSSSADKSELKFHDCVVSSHSIVAGVYGASLNTGSPIPGSTICSNIPRSTIKPDNEEVPDVAPTPGPISPWLRIIVLSSIRSVD